MSSPYFVAFASSYYSIQYPAKPDSVPVILVLLQHCCDMMLKCKCFSAQGTELVSNYLDPHSSRFVAIMTQEGNNSKV